MGSIKLIEERLVNSKIVNFPLRLQYIYYGICVYCRSSSSLLFDVSDI